MKKNTKDKIVFSDIREDADEEDVDSSEPKKVQRADRSAFIQRDSARNYVSKKEAEKIRRRKRKERLQVILILSLIFGLLIITAILFYTPEL